MRKLLFKCMGIIIALSILMLCSACDTGISVKGYVYEWVDAPADASSRIYIRIGPTVKEMEEELNNILEEIPGDITRIGLEGATIQAVNELTGTPLEGYIYQQKEAYVYFEEKSDPAGRIYGHWFSGVHKAKVIISINKTGYCGVAGEGELGANQAVVAILVKK